MALFACNRLTRRPWFENLELVLEPGEIVVLKGPSGSGKTLLLRTLADLDPADAGEVWLDGVERGELPPHRWRRQVVYVHPGGARLEGSVRDNVERVVRLGHAAAPPGSSSPPVDGLDPDSPAARLSSGEAQRLALERALAVSPRVLLLDEPTAHLDEERARTIEARLRDWVAAGRCVLWVSHDGDLAQRLGTREVSFP